MTAISYTIAQENLAATMDQVCNDCNPVIITRGPQACGRDDVAGRLFGLGRDGLFVALAGECEAVA